MSKKVLIGVLIAVLAVGAIATYFAKPDLFTGSAFKIFGSTPSKISKVVPKKTACYPVSNKKDVLWGFTNGQALRTVNHEYNASILNIYFDPEHNQSEADLLIEDTTIRNVARDSREYDVVKDGVIVGRAQIYRVYDSPNNNEDYVALKISEVPPVGAQECRDNETVNMMFENEEFVFTTQIGNRSYDVTLEDIDGRILADILVENEEEGVFDRLAEVTSGEARTFVDANNIAKGDIKLYTFGGISELWALLGLKVK